jgi:integrase/recombinase XerD
MRILDELRSELTLRNYSEKTQDAYIRWNERFIEYTNAATDDVTASHIKSFLSHLISNEKASLSTVNLARSALRFYYESVLENSIGKISAPKPDKKLPVVLTVDEVQQLFEAAATKKSALILKTLYSTGIRVSELCELQVNDINVDEEIGWVRGGKGSKDRMISFSTTLIDKLEEFMDDHGTAFVFPGRDGSMSSRNVQSIVRRTAANAGLTKQVTPHTLRHSFATHMLDQGNDLRLIQELLGHENLQTTQIYTQISSERIKAVENPLDTL